MAKPTTRLEEDFWANVDILGLDDCWPWLGWVDPHGYGRQSATPRMYASRRAWELTSGPVPDGLKIGHLCHNQDKSCAGGDACLHRRCCNPAHLTPVTDRERRLARWLARTEPTESGCLLWTGPLDRYGYGKTGLGKAHRLLYQELVGPIPDGMEIDHVAERGCTSKACVKVVADEFGPAHLEPVTRPENMRRRAALQTHCKHGHLFDEANTHVTPEGWRSCRACGRDAAARYQKRKRVAP